MTFSKQWLVLICAVSIISAVIEAIIPKSESKKAFGFLSAVVLIYSIMLPVIGGNIQEFDFQDLVSKKDSVSQELDKNSAETVLLSVQKGYEAAITEKLGDEGITAEKLRVICEEKEESFVVLTVKIYGEMTATQKQVCKSTVEKLCGSSVQILFFESEGDDE